MNINHLLVFCLVISSVLFTTCQQAAKNENPLSPIPTNGTIIKADSESGDNQSKRASWFELMHNAAPGTDWESIEYQTAMQRHQQRSRARQLTTNRAGEEVLADGNLIGEWLEKGSINQAGSVFVTEYLPDSDELYLISAGGTLFRGTRAGNDWQVVNQDLRFENNFLKYLQTNDGNRWLATVNDIPHYSEDEGSTWTAATGITTSASHAESIDPVVLPNLDDRIYILSKPDYWTNYTLYRSDDKGMSYTSIHTFETNLSSEIQMVKPHHTDEVFIAVKNGGWSTKFYELDQESNTVNLIVQNNSFGFGENGRANLVATQMDTTTRFYAYTDNLEVFQSEDYGMTWEQKGNLPARPWSVGMYLRPSDPDFLIMGEVECFYSPNQGEDWIKVNNWGDYYGDVNGSLHADMMAFAEYETAEGDPFILSSNHGGLNITYNDMLTFDNLGLENLNVSQYYDVVTDPTDPVYIYAGSQDQGFQRSLNLVSDEIANFDQVISGDYGHIVFSENGNRLWTVYPGGWVTYYAFPQTAALNDSWELESQNETVWIPPMMSSPIPEENAIYLAGGNMNGGSGSYLIKLSVADTIVAEQIDYDFQDYSGGGTISMMRTSPINPDQWYVATTNGRFFYSIDGGNNWEQNISFIPGGHYLYGSAILPSKLASNTVYFAGSGYSNPAVYKSTDGGENFTAMNEGLPPTLVFELAANEDESLLFAATEAGPYVFVTAENKWYDMAGMGAPNQTYWSVEYIEQLQLVRFGTYGRGIWDFQISPEVVSTSSTDNSTMIKVWPNPTSDLLQISGTKKSGEQLAFSILNTNGKIVHRILHGSTENSFYEEFSMGHLPKGIYYVLIEGDEQTQSQKVILQ